MLFIADLLHTQGTIHVLLFHFSLENSSHTHIMHQYVYEDTEKKTQVSRSVKAKISELHVPWLICFVQCLKGLFWSKLNHFETYKNNFKSSYIMVYQNSKELTKQRTKREMSQTVFQRKNKTKTKALLHGQLLSNYFWESMLISAYCEKKIY